MDLDRWFVDEVLPHERAVSNFIRRYAEEEAEDLRQEVYARAYNAARERIPDNTRPFLFAIARNLLIDRVRRARIVSIELVAEMDAMIVVSEEPPADRVVAGRQELKRVMNALDDLPPRCREIVRLRKIEGLSQRETAQRMGVTVDTVDKQMAKGIRRLADLLFGGQSSKAAQPPINGNDQAAHEQS